MSVSKPKGSKNKTTFTVRTRKKWNSEVDKLRILYLYFKTSVLDIIEKKALQSLFALTLTLTINFVRSTVKV